jgi:hypothetical protein
MKQTTRLHGIFRSVIDWTIAPCEATPIASQDLLITGWKKSMRVSQLPRLCLPERERTQTDQSSRRFLNNTGQENTGWPNYESTS